jgi:zinc/manganese transport system substrate-binding protein
MSKKSLLIIGASLAGLVLISVVLSLVKGTSPNDSAGRLKVVVAENTWGSIAAQIGGSRVDVTSIITDPAADPHLYESGAKDASAITSADVVIVNGLGYDDFVTKILEGSPNKNRVVINVANFLGAKDGDNPHFWYDIGRVNIVAVELQKQFAAKDTAGADSYQANLATFADSLQPLYNRLDNILSTYPKAPVAYTERVAGYMLTQAGLQTQTPPGFAAAMEEGNEPSPADQAAMLGLLTGKKIKVLLYNPQASSAVTDHIRDVAAQNDIPTVAVTETIPGGTTYQLWMQDQLNALTIALAK